MPVHDWTRVSDATFHDFHYSWVLEIKRALMRGLLPEGYYVMAEQFGGDLGAPDVLTLRTARTACKGWSSGKPGWWQWSATASCSTVCKHCDARPRQPHKGELPVTRRRI